MLEGFANFKRSNNYNLTFEQIKDKDITFENFVAILQEQTRYGYLKGIKDLPSNY